MAMIRLRGSQGTADSANIEIWGAQFVHGSSELSYQARTGAGASDRLVKTWYDQSGNGRNASQADPDKQPKIYDVIKQSIVKLNSYPAIEWFDLDQGFNFTSTNPCFN